MITSINIDNYKGLTDFNINGMKRITLVSGVNNVGKTSVLEAVFLLHNFLAADPFYSQYFFRNMSAYGNVGADIWSPFFYNYNSNKNINITVTYDGGTTGRLECQILKNNVLSDKMLSMLYPSFGNIVAINNAVRISGNVNTLLGLNYYQNDEMKFNANLCFNGTQSVVEILNVYKGEDLPQVTILFPTDNQSINSIDLSKLDIDNKMDNVIEFLKVIEPKIKGLSIVPTYAGGSEIYIDIGLAKKIPVKMMGYGFVRQLKLILTLAAYPKSVLLIDEIENGTHYSYMKNIWHNVMLAAKMFDCQIIASSHSYECIRAASEGIIDSDELAYVRLDNRDSHIVTKVFDNDMLSMAFKHDMEIR